MNIYKNPQQIAHFLSSLTERRSDPADAKIRETVTEVLQAVRTKGLTACLDYTLEWDKVKLAPSGVHIQLEGKFANAALDSQFWKAAENAVMNIREFCKHQIYQGFEIKKDGRTLGEKVVPLDRVGCYVPGGSAPLISTVMMTVIPAKMAGVREVVVCTPPEKHTGKINPYILALCQYLEVNEVLLLGGAQSIAALSFGLKPAGDFAGFRPVQKIVGPGNMFVTEAKRQVFGTVDIDMLAGPSEIAVLSDGFAVPDFIAADLLSQLEHDPNALGVYVTVSEEELNKVVKAFHQQLETSERQGILSKSCPNVVFILTSDVISAAAMINEIAPEHLEIMVKDRQVLKDIHFKAGAVFWGDHTPVAVGDFYGGTNHVLPTAGRASFSSPLSVYDFMRRTQYVEFTGKGIREHAPYIQILAEKEMLPAHENSVKLRTTGKV